VGASKSWRRQREFTRRAEYKDHGSSFAPTPVIANVNGTSSGLTILSQRKTRIKEMRTVGGEQQQCDLIVEAIISTVVGERGISAGAGGTNVGGVTRAIGELEIVAERARLLEILGEHLITPDVGI